jgi:phospholipase/carboxylesterase
MADHYEPNEKVRGLPVLVQHGLHDNVIPVENGRRIATYLRAVGADVQHKDYPMGHEVSFNSLVDLKLWLADQMIG